MPVSTLSVTARARSVPMLACLALLLIPPASAVSLGQTAAASAPRAGQAPVDVAALDAYIAQARADWDVPGLAVAIVKDGRIVLEKGYGVRERGRPEPVDARTLFAIASNTKAFTAAALAILVDQAHVSWDDPVRKHLPALELRDPVATADLRVSDLLSHRAGLGTFSGDLLWYGTSFSRQEVLRRTRFLQPRYPFRYQYGYSNVMFVAAGEVIAAASGATWDVFVRDQLFQPLGMNDTLTSITSLPGRANVATPHGPVGTGARPYPWYNWDGAAAAAGIISSVHDMSRWLMLQLGRGTLDGRTFFTEAQSRTMWTPHVSFTIGKDAEARSPTTHFRGYGLGWGVRDYQGRLVISHGGAYDGMYSSVALVPESRLGVVVLTNGMTEIGDALAARVMDAFLGVPARDWSGEGLAREREHVKKRQDAAARVREARVAGTRPSLPLDAYGGRYSGNFYGEATVTVEGGALVLRLLANPDLVADLAHWHYDTFNIAWRKSFPWFDEGKALFVLDNRGRVARLELNVPNEDFWFEEIDLHRQQ